MVFMPHWPKVLGKRPIEFGLERVFQLLEKLGNPHQKLPPVIHVAGTNGKGSTIALMQAMLEAAGYKVHVYTSPHLLNYNERIVLKGDPISDDHLHQILEECRIAATDIPVTFFEGTTVGALLAFANTKADIVLLETGMGGRLDATNVIDHPLVTILTPISIDHTEYLGPTIDTITREKLGILKERSPCISSLQSETANTLIQKYATSLNIPLYAMEYDWIAEKNNDQLFYQSQFRGNVKFPLPALLGDHQIINAGTAITAMHMIRDQFIVSDENIAKGLLNVTWPGRMQHINFSTIPNDWELWTDCAHNEAGSHILANAIHGWDDKPLYMICGMTKGRDIQKFLTPLKDKVTYLCGSHVTTEPSAYSGQEVAKVADSMGIDATGFYHVEHALDFIIKNKPGPARILCCGSMYLTSDLLKLTSPLDQVS